MKVKKSKMGVGYKIFEILEPIWHKLKYNVMDLGRFCVRSWLVCVSTIGACRVFGFSAAPFLLTLDLK